MNTPIGDAAHYRREAIGAFAHDIRTPLTALRMAIDIGRHAAPPGSDSVILDDELAAMVASALGDVELLVDTLQESSRLERGKLRLDEGPADLSRVVDHAAALADGTLALDGAAPPLQGPWDAARLARAIAAIAGAVARVSGRAPAGLSINASARSVALEITAGDAHASDEPFVAGAGFAYFHARQTLETMGAMVSDAHGPGYARASIILPR